MELCMTSPRPLRESDFLANRCGGFYPLGPPIIIRRQGCWKPPPRHCQEWMMHRARWRTPEAGMTFQTFPQHFGKFRMTFQTLPRHFGKSRMAFQTIARHFGKFRMTFQTFPRRFGKSRMTFQKLPRHFGKSRTTFQTFPRQFGRFLVFALQNLSLSTIPKMD